MEPNLFDKAIRKLPLIRAWRFSSADIFRAAVQDDADNSSRYKLKTSEIGRVKKIQFLDLWQAPWHPSDYRQTSTVQAL